MAPMLSIKYDTRAFSQLLTDVQRKQLPFATMTALNSLAFQAQQVERSAFGQVLAHPRPFTQKSVLVTKAKKSNLSVTIFVKPEVASYLDPFEFGGVHVVPGKLLLNPVGLRLDKYGQLTRTQVTALNTAANTPTSGVFLGTVHGIFGYWQRVGSGTITKRGNLRQLGLRLLAKLEQPGAVKTHLEFESRGVDFITKQADVEFTKALVKALATAKP
jgi:hypothetical protein